MRLYDYQKLALRTANIVDSRTIDRNLDLILHGAIGLSGEIAEIFASEDDPGNLAEEIGDSSWYIAICMHGLRMDMENLDPEKFKVGDAYKELVVHAGIVLDQAKRAIYYKAEIDDYKILNSLSTIYACLEYISVDTPFDYEDCLKKNIEKLKIRYPESFTENNAVNRNTSKEYGVFKL